MKVWIVLFSGLLFSGCSNLIEVGNFSRGMREAMRFNNCQTVIENNYHKIAVSGDLGLVAGFGSLVWDRAKNKTSWTEFGRKTAGHLLLGKVSFELGWRVATKTGWQDSPWYWNGISRESNSSIGWLSTKQGIITLEAIMTASGVYLAYF